MFDLLVRLAAILLVAFLLSSFGWAIFGWTIYEGTQKTYICRNCGEKIKTHSPVENCPVCGTEMD